MFTAFGTQSPQVQRTKLRPVGPPALTGSFNDLRCSSISGYRVCPLSVCKREYICQVGALSNLTLCDLSLHGAARRPFPGLSGTVMPSLAAADLICRER